MSERGSEKFNLTVNDVLAATEAERDAAIERATYAEVELRNIISLGFRDLSQSQLETIAREREIALRDQLLVEAMTKLNRDPLTGALNRLGLEEAYDKLFHGRSQRKEDRQGKDVPLGSIFFFDIDNFKPINDTFGHDVGDQTLISVFGTARNQLRDRDILGRLGGDEGIGILPRTSLKDAIGVCEKIRGSISEIQEVGGHIVKLSVSVGVDQVKPGLFFGQAIRPADAAMYDAKNNGGNQVRSITQ